MTAPTVVRYEPRGAAIELFTSRENEIVMSGPAGTGKSVACLFRMHLAALNNPGFRGLILRKTAVSLGSTTLVTYREKVAKAALDQRIVTWYGGSRQEAACYRYHRDGAVAAVIVVGGLDRPEKIMSSEYDLVFVDEATELTLTDWETIGTRLRNGQRARQQQIAACNPDSEHHWMIQRAQAGTLRMLYSTHRDNPAYVNRDGSYTEAGRTYVQGKLAALTGIRRQRLFEGKWTSAEGIVYDGWDPAVHLVDRLPKGSETWTRWWTVDFGYTNPFVCQFWAEDPDGRLWLYREIYKTKTLVEDHAKAILRLVRRCAVCCKSNAADHDCHDCKSCQLEWTEPKPRAVICDHDAEDRATLERHLGMGTSKAHKTVKDGVQAVAARLRVLPDGRPRLYIVRNAVVAVDKELEAAKLPLCTEQEITGYVWPEGVKPDQRENPVKKDDHGCFVAGTRVATRSGAVPIEDVRAGDQVLTRAGFRNVTASGMTSMSAYVCQVVLSDGAVLTGTGNHPVWVEGAGWTRLDALRYADRILACQTPNPYASETFSSVATPTRRTGLTASTTRPGSPIKSAESVASMRRSGRLRTVPYPSAATFTMLTSTRSTTSSKISPASPGTNTPKPTRGAGGHGSAGLKGGRIWSESAPSRQLGTHPPRASHGIVSTPPRWLSGRVSCIPAPASTAMLSMRRRALTDLNASAPTSARRRLVAPAASMTYSASVPFAASSSPSTVTPVRPAADVHVLSVCELIVPAPVFNLTVADVPEYFAEGILVHNCDAMRYMVAQRDLGPRPGIRIIR